MSASLLNFAAMPGVAAGQPGAAVGIAQQAAQAAQAQGPLAGFEALLAAFFGDQGLTLPGAGGAGAVAQGPLALIAGQAAPQTAQAGAKPGDGKAGKSDKTLGGTDKADAEQPAAGLADASANAQDAAALALIVPQAAVQPGAAPQAGGDDLAESAPDTGQPAKPAAQVVLADLATVATAADAKSANGLAVAAQAAADVGGPAKPDGGQATSIPTTQPDTAKPDLPAQAKTAFAAAGQLQAPALTDQAAAVTTQALSPPGQGLAAAQVKPADTVAVPAKDKGQEIKAVRVEGAPTGPAPLAGGPAKAAETVQAAADLTGKDAGAHERDDDAAQPADPKTASTDASQPAGAFNTALSAQSANATALAHAAALVRGAPQTVANLAAQIARKLDGRSTRFDVQLEPAGLGKVDVRVEIDAAGKMSAALAFDNQQAAAELKSRAGELQRALEQAGFDLSGGLSFDVSGQGGQAQGQQDDTTPAFRGRAFQAVLNGETDPQAPLSAYRPAADGGLDIRI
jgi:hypothetical protein